MHRNRGFDQFDPARLEPLEGPRFVQLQQTAVAGDVSGEDGGELAFDERAVFSQHCTLIRVEIRPSKFLVDQIRHFAPLEWADYCTLPHDEVGRAESAMGRTTHRRLRIVASLRGQLILIIGQLVYLLTRPARNASTVCITPRSSARPLRRPMNE
jgi:hypothetical protein